VKESAKYVALLFLFIAVAFVLSWCAVYNYWIAAHVFHSVHALRVGDAIGSVILFPVRTFLEATGGGGMMDTMTLLTNPLLYVSINAALVGIIAYALCRRWIFRPKGGG